jgi:uncharacterized SAM-binding protein YcdF (DUF218 family)
VAERVVAVLGYSGRDTSRLHPICAHRLARAQELAADGETVILSGWARRNGGTSEAELMQAAWRTPAVVLHGDRTAGSTAGNAANVAAVATALGAREIVVVTSGWHRLRTRILFRAALRGRRLRLRVEGAPGPRPAAVLARELVCVAGVPFQLWRVKRMARRDGEHTRQLAERAQDELDRRKQPGT